MSVFFISDHHLGDKDILSYNNYDGNPMRNFKNLDEMHNFIISEHNKVVKPSDKVFFLGDVVIDSKYFYLLNELNGKKRLILGNHDTFTKSKKINLGNEIFFTNEYQKYFEDVLSYKVFPNNFICSHVPLSIASFKKFKYNVHGHLHNSVVKIEDSFIEDYRYFNVSCERLNFTPISYDEINMILNSIFRTDEYMEKFGKFYE